MSNSAMRAWCWIHKWSSLVCTLFLLMLCLTGLPLVFHEEIDRLTQPPAQRIVAVPGQPLLDPDAAIAAARARHPGTVPLYLSFDTDRPVANVTLAPRPDALEREMVFVPIDLTSGREVTLAKSQAMDVLLEIHKNMFLGFWGMLFLGAMGALFVAATVSGVVIYAPFMRKVSFGTVRRTRAARTTWLDYHNLLGIVTMAWAMVVGLTGTINTLADPITDWWRADTLSGLIAHAGREGTVAPYRLGTATRALDAALAERPGTKPQFMAFPGTTFSTPDHLTVFLQGARALDEKLLTPVLVDARSAKVDAVAPMPWYMKALLLAQPLHFGDYGGLPMKVLWALLDMVTIVVVGTGLYLWLDKHARRKPATPRRHVENAVA